MLIYFADTVVTRRADERVSGQELWFARCWLQTCTNHYNINGMTLMVLLLTVFVVIVIVAVVTLKGSKAIEDRG